MPVTARLSRRLYEQLGDDVANELVDWFNLVDNSYRQDLKDFNELNFARFDAKVEQRFAESDARVDKRFAESEVKFDKRSTESESRLMRWMFTFWSTNLLAFAGLALAVMRTR
jgi:hypothetical protein